MIIGNLEITEKKDCVVLRLFTFVEGHPGAVYTYDEIANLAARLQSIAKRKGAEKVSDTPLLDAKAAYTKSTASRYDNLL